MALLAAEAVLSMALVLIPTLLVPLHTEHGPLSPPFMTLWSP